MITGVVQDVSSKMVNTKFGPKPVYTLKVNDEFFDAGFSKKNIAEIGTMVTLDTEVDRFGKTKIKSLTLGGAGGSSPTPPSTASSPSPKSGYVGRDRPFPIPDSHGDRSIVRQNALTNAREFYSNYKTKAISELTELRKAAEEVIELAYMFEEYTSGQREVRAAEKLAKAGGVSE